jgi:glycine C-acetyltransferase
MLGEAHVAQQFARELFAREVMAVPIFFPTVAKGRARIRNMVSAAHSHTDLDVALAGYEAVGKAMGVI